MAIASSDKLVVVKAFAMGNPLPLDAREIYESLAEAKSYAATSAVAYAGQTIKVVEDGIVTAYSLAPSDVEGENYKLEFLGGGGSGIQSVETAEKAGAIKIAVVEGDATVTKTVPVVGAVVEPVIDEENKQLVLKKVTEDASYEEIVVPLAGAVPENGMVSNVEVAEDGISFTVTTFDPDTETESTKNVKLTGVAGTVTAVSAAEAGLLSVTTMGEDGQAVAAKQAVIGSVINATYDADTKVITLPVVTGVNAEGAVTTSAVTVDLKTIVAAAFVDVTHTADTEDTSAKYEFKYNDATGAEQTKTVYETGVRKVEAGSVADKIKVTTAGTTGALTSTEILIGAGSVKNPTYDTDTRKITLPILQADGTTQALEINLGQDMVVKSGVYNAETQEIELTLTDGSVVRVPAASLVDVYTGEATATVSVSVSENKISATLKVSTIEKNLLKTDENGAYVVEADFTETKQLIVDAEAAAKQYTDDEMAKEVTARDKAIADAIAQEVTNRNEAIATAKGEANTYADEKDAENLEAAKAYADEKASASDTAAQKAADKALEDAKAYTDEKIAAEVTARDEAIADAVAQEVTDRNQAISGAIAQEVTDRNQAITDAINTEVTNRNNAIATSLADAKKYTDEQIAAEVIARDEAIADAVALAKTEVNKYTDDAVAAEVTARDKAIADAVAAAKTEVNNYTDTQVAGALINAKSYTDTQIAAAIAQEVTDRDAAIASAVSAAKTAWVDFGAED